jgi:exonuclease 3'-5' domain-containing protein 1
VPIHHTMTCAPLALSTAAVLVAASAGSSGRHSAFRVTPRFRSRTPHRTGVFPVQTHARHSTHSGGGWGFAFPSSARRRGNNHACSYHAVRHCHSVQSQHASMGKKTLLHCAQCAVEFKKKTTTTRVGGRHFCGATCSALGPSETETETETLFVGYGDVPPASSFGATKAPCKSPYADTYAIRGYDSGSDRNGGGQASTGPGPGVDKRAAKRKRKKTKKGRTENGAQNVTGRPVETDPACVKILAVLDGATRILTSPGPDLDDAIAKCVSCNLLAVDLEGVSMSRVGQVTLLQVATDTDVFLFDVQALSTETLFHRYVEVDEVAEVSGDGDTTDVAEGVGARSIATGDGDTTDVAEGIEVSGDRDTTHPNTTSKNKIKKTLQQILEDPSVTKLMFDCRVDSDALFHQHGVSLKGVFDVQLADVASRRAKSLSVPHLSGMPKCAMRHLNGTSGATKSSLAALDADPDCVTRNQEGASSSEAEAVIRVTEFLKTKVKALYAPDKGGDPGLWALRPISPDARRYAALDVWLLLKIHRAMIENGALDEEWRVRVEKASKHRETEYRELKTAILQFRDPERAVAPDL